MSHEVYMAIGAGVLYTLEKTGVFSWIGKLLHSRLPREKNMSVRNLLRNKPHSVALQDGRVLWVQSPDQITFLDDVLVIRLEQGERVVASHYYWKTVSET